MSDIKLIEDRLKAPLPVSDIEWRIARCGKKSDGTMWGMVLAYKTSRADMDRLDDVVGIAGWKDTYEKFNGSYICGVSLLLNGEWITKYDGSDETHIEAVKGGISGAFKRACTKWGIGRYLYKLSETFVTIYSKKGNDGGKWKYINDDKKGVKGYWQEPSLPGWAIPKIYEINKDRLHELKNVFEVKKDIVPVNQRRIQIESFLNESVSPSPDQLSKAIEYLNSLEVEK